MELKMVFNLINVANVVNMSQPGARIGGGLHALIRIFWGLFTCQAGSGNMSPAPVSLRGSRRSSI